MNPCIPWGETAQKTPHSLEWNCAVFAAPLTQTTGITPFGPGNGNAVLLAVTSPRLQELLYLAQGMATLFYWLFSGAPRPPRSDPDCSPIMKHSMITHTVYAMNNACTIITITGGPPK